jgi:ATP-dependent DNA helicase PIF1
MTGLKKREEGLSESQKKAIAIIEEDENIYICGPAGTGKSFLLSKIYDILRSKGKRIYVTATTGIAASLIGGTTLHNHFGTGIVSQAKTPEMVYSSLMRYNPKSVDRIKKTDVIIIDEWGMADNYVWIMDRVCRLIRKNKNRSFGGIQIISFGDPFQLPPIKSAYLFEDLRWLEMKFKMIELKENFRQFGDDLFIKILSEVRMGKISDEMSGVMSQRVFSKMTTRQIKLDLARSIGDEEYVQTLLAINDDPSLDTTDDTLERSLLLSNTTHIYVRNKDAIDRNNQIYDKIKSREKIYHGKIIPSDASRHIFTGLVAYDILKLKIGCKVLLIVNLKVGDDFLGNGTRGYVRDFDDCGNPEVVFMKKNKEVLVTVHEHTWTQKVNIPGRGRVKCMFRQRPLILAYAVTVNRSQGARYSSAYICTNGMNRLPGNLYTSMSRVERLYGTFLSDWKPELVNTSKSVLNYHIHGDKWILETFGKNKTQEERKKRKIEDGHDSNLLHLKKAKINGFLAVK